MRSSLLPLSATVGALMLVALGAPPAGAASGVIAAPNGVAGIGETVTVSAPSLAGQSVAVNATQGATTTAITVPLNSAGLGVAPWTPGSAGTWTLSGAGSLTASSSVSVAAVPTVTTISAANEAPINTVTTLVATVTATSGSLQPRGSATFTNTFGSTLGTVELIPVPGTASSTASLGWTPANGVVFPINATYNPTPTSGALGSTSGTDQVQVLAFTNPTVTLRMPDQFRLGTPVTITAITPWQDSGTVAFTANNVGISGSVPTVGGLASISWTPTTFSNVTIVASYTASNGVTGVGQQVVGVQAALAADAVTATVPSSLAKGGTAALTASTLSGAPVVLGTGLPCAISGSTLMAMAGSGTCSVTALSPGTAAYGSNTATYSVVLGLGRQTAAVSAPKSGSSIKAGRTVTLARAGANKTSAGKTITWRVTKGASSCTLSTSNGVRLRATSKGTCTVRATAPAVPGQYAAYSATYTYRIV